MSKSSLPDQDQAVESAAPRGDARISDSPEMLDAIGFVDWDLPADRLIWDDGAEKRFGVPAGSMSSFERWAEFVHPDDVARIRADAAAAAAGRQDRLTYRYRFRPQPGDAWRLIEGVALCWYGPDAVLARMTGVALDITRSVANRDALARSEAQLRTIIETLPDAMLTVDRNGAVRTLNPIAEQIFGDRAATVVGHDIASLIPAVFGSPAGRAEGSDLTTLARAMIGQTQSARARRADGSDFPIDLNIGEAAQGSDGNFTCLIRDISERVDAALRLDEIRTQYLRTARLNAMGTVAAGLAHELNQPLAAGANYLAASTRLLDQGRSPEEISALIAGAREQITLAGDIIRRLRGFLAQGDQHRERLVCADVIAEAVALALAGNDRKTISVEFSAKDMPDLFADRVQLLQIFVNLLRNAVEAMANQPERQVNVTAQSARGLVYLTVADNGPGFEQAILGAMEGAVVSTKGSEGMGFGLSICRRIVDGWHGSLKIANPAKGGAAITFSVPAFDATSDGHGDG